MPINCTFPRVDKQKISCVKRLGGKPALFEMDFQKENPMTLKKFRNIGKEIKKNMPKCPDILYKIDLEWKHLNDRSENQIGNMIQ